VLIDEKRLNFPVEIEISNNAAAALKAKIMYEFYRICIQINKQSLVDSRDAFCQAISSNQIL
jgi:hypothetical protein